MKNGRELLALQKQLADIAPFNSISTEFIDHSNGYRGNGLPVVYKLDYERAAYYWPSQSRNGIPSMFTVRGIREDGPDIPDSAMADLRQKLAVAKEGMDAWYVGCIDSLQVEAIQSSLSGEPVSLRKMFTDKIAAIVEETQNDLNTIGRSVTVDNLTVQWQEIHEYAFMGHEMRIQFDVNSNSGFFNAEVSVYGDYRILYANLPQYRIHSRQWIELMQSMKKIYGVRERV